MKDKQKQISCRVSDEVWEKLQKLKKDSGLTMTAIISKLIMGYDIKPLNTDELLNLLNSKGSIKSAFNRQGHDDNIYFIDSSKLGPQQIKCFINKSACDKIERRIKDHFSIKKNYYRYHDEMDDGTAVVNCTSCNLVAIKHVKELIVDEGQNVIIIHFFFQLPYLQKYFGDGDNVEYCLFSYESMFGE